jgi:pimeloyl-ACP methyl ester carboxylesterase
MNLAADRGGSGDRLLVLLHGLGTTRDVWRPMLRSAGEHWTGSWIAPDLRGHGASAPAASYVLGSHAADVGELALGSGNWREIVVLGHSMGGAIALALASGWFGFTPARVFGLGIKVAWSNEERAGMQRIACTPPRHFANKAEAAERYLKIAGLSGLLAPDSPEAEAGIRHTGQGWRLAYDPAAASIGPPPMGTLLAAAQCPVHLARGESDALVTRNQFRAYDPHAEDIAGAGHNAMVEKPDAVWAWLSSHLHEH